MNVHRSGSSDPRRTPIHRMISIKICGITREQDLAYCDELGIEFVGLNFVPHSPRRITIDRAIALTQGLRRSRAVGIFIGGTTDNFGEILDRVPLDAVQIYHPTPRELRVMKQKKIRVIRAFRSIPKPSALRSLVAAGHQILIDGPMNGAKPDLSAIADLPLPIRQHLFLAGGLNAENVSGAIKQIHPFAVDVASGVESSPGIKDHGKMRAFVQTVSNEGNQRNQGFQGNQRT